MGGVQGKDIPDSDTLLIMNAAEIYRPSVEYISSDRLEVIREENERKALLMAR